MLAVDLFAQFRDGCNAGDRYWVVAEVSGNNTASNACRLRWFTADSELFGLHAPVSGACELLAFASDRIAGPAVLITILMILYQFS